MHPQMCIIMGQCHRYPLAGVISLVGIIFGVGILRAPAEGVFREVWTGIEGTAVADLTNDPNFPGHPDSEEILTEAFEAPTDVMDYYGQRLRALVTAPATGNYIFWIAGDDNCELWLSSDASPANRELIASVPGWTASRVWDKYSEQESKSIRLVGGQAYYIEALMKEHGGGDNLAVRWQLPGGAMEEPISGGHLEPYGLAAPEITRQPEDVTVFEGGTAEFYVEVAKYLGVSFQWQRDGNDIRGANAANLVLENLALEDSGTTYRVVLTNNIGTVTSDPATLTVVVDDIPPNLESVVNLGNPNTLTVNFSEPVEAATAANPENYQIDHDVAVEAARWAGGRVVILKTSELSSGTIYTLTVNNVRDQASVPNPVAPDSQATFSFDYTPLAVEDLSGRPEPPGPSSRITGLIVSEVMYHPAPRDDLRNLEFIEIFNTHDWDEDLSGYRISGTADFTFPAGTILRAREYLVVAAAPGDIELVLGLSGVLGPYAGSLPNDAGIVRLRHPTGGLYQEVRYRDRDPWPEGCDGTGHSIVLVRPSYGEGDPRAWRRSVIIGGSPGAAEPEPGHAWDTLCINEYLAHTDDPDLDFVEIFNYSEAAVDASGCILTDDRVLDKYVIPAGTMIPARGYLALDQTALGFALNSGGEMILLKTPDGSRVIDAVRFGGQENGVATGRYPDAVSHFHPLREPTPGSANAPHKTSDIVINEIMYNPLSGENDDEYVELLNPGEAPVDLGGWKLRDDIQFTFPTPTSVGPGEFLVVAKNAQRLIANYAQLDASNTVGDFSQALNNRGGRIRLEMPDQVVDVTPTGSETNTIWIVVDEVAWNEGGRWGEWADGGGSSLELIDPHSDNRMASNWADSDESGKAPWTQVEHTGVLDNGQGSIDELHVMLLSGGEAMVDDLNVSLAGQANQLPNANFENGLDGWVRQGNHVFTQWSAPGEGYQGGRAMHLVATGGGDNGANRVESDLNSTFSAGQTSTISAHVRWLKGSPHILLRLHGNHLELSGTMEVPSDLGTPGLPNSRLVHNAGPVIQAVRHDPLLPAPNQTVGVIARVEDPDGISQVVLRYRIDPDTEYIDVNMEYRGGGIFRGEIPGQPDGTMVGFRVVAVDAHEVQAANSFPDSASTRSDCLVRFGADLPSTSGHFGVYRFWVAEENLNEWVSREKMSNQLIDTTFVYGDARVIYNVGGRFRGSPFIRPGYSSPASPATTAMVYEFPKDNRFLGAKKINLDGLEQPGRDDTLQREKMSMWIGEQLGVPFSYQRYVHLYVNGTSKGEVYTDSHQPDAEYIRAWFPSMDNGELYKIDDWFEFTDSVLREFNINADLQPHTTTGGVYKQARYRWSWEKKTNGGLDDDYSSLFNLVDALNAGDSTSTEAVEAIVDVDQWMRVFATRHIVADWDGYGYNRGKNQSAYKPVRGRWQMLLWDLDFSLGGGSDPADADMFSCNDPTIGRLYAHLPFRRMYYQAWNDAVNGPLTAAESGPVMDAIYAALQANGANVNGPSAIKSWIQDRRNYLLGQLAAVEADFAITSNSGKNFSTPESLVDLRGTAPLAAKTIRVNGVSYPVTWESVQTWHLQVPLGPGASVLNVEAYDRLGNPIGGASAGITITFTGETEWPEDHLVINEIMYHPAVPDTAFLEVFNTSTTHAFDLSGMILNGMDFTFPEGTVIEPGGFSVIANDPVAFQARYGVVAGLIGPYAGKLDNGGETLSLIDPGATSEEDVLIDTVTYDDDQPWPALADGSGSSLQLIDPDTDNNRVANWDALATVEGSGQTTTLVNFTDVWAYDQSGSDLGTAWKEPGFDDSAWPSGAGLLYVENAELPQPKNTLLTREGQITYYFRHEFTVTDAAGVHFDAQLVVDDGAIVYLNGEEVLRVGMGGGAVAYDTRSARTVGDATTEYFTDLPATALVAGENVLAVEVHQTNTGSSDVVFGLQLDAVLQGTLAATPGAINSTAANLSMLPQVWLNEVQPENFTTRPDGHGEFDPWIEIYNSGDTIVDLAGYFLSNDYAQPEKWAFPAGATLNPGQFLVVWLDGEPAESLGSEYHAGFSAALATGSVVLTRDIGSGPVVVDYLNYQDLSAGRSFGAFPDGTAGRRGFFLVPTPGAPNDNSSPPISVVFNEWMADNLTTAADPGDGRFEDWFELYNAGGEAVDLSGYFLSDDPLAPRKFTIPAGVIIPANGFLVFWADEDLGQESSSEHHADFKLSRAGESLLLSAPDLTAVDSVTFAAQSADVSEGRLPDGAPEPFLPLDAATPGTSNQGEDNTNQPPVLDPVGDWTVEEGSLLSFAVTASDPDQGGQSLSFSLDAGAPAGAVIDPPTGVFTWQPGESAGPGNYGVTIRVTDDGTPALSDSETITISVREVNAAPRINAITDRSGEEGNAIRFVVTADDLDLPAQVLTFSLDDGAPAGAGIDPATGEFTWTPAEEQGGMVAEITVRVTDNGSPPLDAAESFSVNVAEMNQAPMLSLIGNQSVAEGETLDFVVDASDSDLPTQTLSYSISEGAPEGASLDAASGRFQWQPTEAQGPGTYFLTFQVADNGSPALTNSQIVHISVTEVNSAPTLAAVADQTAYAETDWRLMLAAQDTDLPEQTLTYVLTGTVPEGMSLIEETGELQWTPTPAQIGDHTISVEISDDGSPSGMDSLTFLVTVLNNPSDVAITSIEIRDALGIRLSWTSVPGLTYQIQSKSDLAEAAWTDLGEITATQNTSSFTDDTPMSPSRFYRILLP